MNESLKIKRCIFLGTLLCLLSLSSCLEKTVSSNNNESSSDRLGNNNSDSDSDGRGDDDNIFDGGGDDDEGEGFGDGSEPGISDGGQDQEYYTLQNIVVKGRADPFDGDPDEPFWSSTENFPSQDRHIFFTDSRFNLRVIPRTAPSQNSKTAADGSLCDQEPLNYDRLQIDVCVRAQGSTCSSFRTATFSNVPVDGASKVKEFPVPVTSEPLVVEIRDVQWDWTCDWYGNPTSGFGAQFCPFSAVGYKDCVRFDMQFSTDDTKDVPGPRM